MSLHNTSLDKDGLSYTILKEGFYNFLATMLSTLDWHIFISKIVKMVSKALQIFPNQNIMEKLPHVLIDC